MFKKQKIRAILTNEIFKATDRNSGSYEGVRVILDDNSEIRFGISADRNCCEQFGFIEANELDDYEKFIGANILEVSCVRDPNVHFNELVELEDNGYCMCLDTEFINIKTTKGVMNFAVYNHHNGYYGHDVIAFHINKNKTVEEFF